MRSGVLQLRGTMKTDNAVWAGFSPWFSQGENHKKWYSATCPPQELHCPLLPQGTSTLLAKLTVYKRCFCFSPERLQKNSNEASGLSDLKRQCFCYNAKIAHSCFHSLVNHRFLNCLASHLTATFWYHHSKGNYCISLPSSPLLEQRTSWLAYFCMCMCCRLSLRGSSKEGPGSWEGTAAILFC